MTTDKESPIKFPCDHIIKVVGAAGNSFEETATNIIRKHFPDISDDKIIQRTSGNNNYLSLTFTVHATSREQLDALYQELSDTPEVLFAL